MNRNLGLGMGLALIFIGVMALAFSAFGAIFHFRFWQLWPAFVLAAGLLMVVPGLFARKRGWSWLLIPGLPTLTTGGILLVGSVFRWWSLWSIFWPLEVISLALGFALAALRTRTAGLWVPVILIGANGFVLQFCAFTGWWSAWSVLWSVEPLALGIALLALNVKRHSTGLFATGLTFCGLGVLGFLQSMTVVSLFALRPLMWIWRWVGPLSVIVAGLALLVWGLLRKDTGSRSQASAPVSPALAE